MTKNYQSQNRPPDCVNLVYVKKGYHRVLHTNLYYMILNTSIEIGYIVNGSDGVVDVLGFFQSSLGAL